MRTVDVSILVTNYNNGRYLDVFFASISNSSVVPKQLVFVDDGSTDNSLEIVKKYDNLSFLILHVFEQNKGRAEALNVGKKLCTSKYTLIIDPDDIMLPDRIEKQYEYMEKNQEIDVLGGNVHYFNDETGDILNVSNFPTKKILETFENGENGILQPTIIVKTNIFKNYKYKKIVPGQDYELFARMAKDGYKFTNLPDVLNKMRVHHNSAVSSMTYASIRNIFIQRDRIFNKKTTKFKAFSYYLHLKMYRKGMLHRNILIKYMFYLFSVFFYPKKIFSRLKRAILR